MKDKTIVFYIFIRYRTISLVPLYIGPAQAAIHLDVTISNNHVNIAKWCTIINEKTWLCWYKRLFCTNSAEKNPLINNVGQGFVIRCTPPVQPSHGNKCLYKISLVLWIQTTATSFFIRINRSHWTCPRRTFLQWQFDQQSIFHLGQHKLFPPLQNIRIAWEVFISPNAVESH